MFFFLKRLTKKDIECTGFEEGSILNNLGSCWFDVDFEKERFPLFCLPSS